MEDRVKAREKLRENFKGELGDYLVKLDELMASSAGRYLVENINATFELEVKGDKMHMCFVEGRVGLG